MYDLPDNIDLVVKDQKCSLNVRNNTECLTSLLFNTGLEDLAMEIREKT